MKSIGNYGKDAVGQSMWEAAVATWAVPVGQSIALSVCEVKLLIDPSPINVPF